MSNEMKRKSAWLGLLVGLILVVGAVIYSIWRREPATRGADGYADRYIQAEQKLGNSTARARTWGPAYEMWYGQEAPDFALTDLEGNSHRLSDYRGREVMLVFWATWCRPCVQEAPHLIELRKSRSEDELAILTISYVDSRNTEEAINEFVRAKGINYTVLPAKAEEMPAPFNAINAIPSSFFVDKEGKIKLATSGLLTLADMKAIVIAEK